MPGKVEVVFHEKAGFPDSGLCLGKVYFIDLPVRFLVVFKNAVVCNASIFVIFQTVDNEITDNPIPFVLGEVLGSKDEIYMVCTLPEVSTRGVKDPEIKPDIQASVNIAAERCMEENFFFPPLHIFKICVGLQNFIVFDAVVLIKEAIERVDSIIESTVLCCKSGDEVPVILPGITQCTKEVGLFRKRCIVLESG